MSHIRTSCHIYLLISLQAPLASNTFFLTNYNKQAKLARRTNTDPNHDLAHRIVPEIGSCVARARPMSQLGAY